MKHSAVIGCGFGDEGKGRVVNYLCSKSTNPLVIRFSGGHQAGHHVVTERDSHVFSNFGSGGLLGADTYWSYFCTVDPLGIVNELNILNEKGFNPTLYIDERCPVTTPYDKYYNIKSEQINNHGSCGVGFGATLQREQDRYSLLFRDLFNPTILKIKLNLIDEYYHKISLNINSFLEHCKKIVGFNNIKKTFGFPNNSYSDYIFEGSQGLLLDQDIGFFPHVSRTNCGSKNILEMGFRPELFLVTRAYQTRHGNGPMTNEDVRYRIKQNPYEQNIDDCFQGKFRRTMLDLDLLEYAINSDDYIRQSQNKTLVITCIDLILGQFGLTVNNRVEKYKNKYSFLNKIKDHLDINKVLLSSSPIHPIHCKTIGNTP